MKPFNHTVPATVLCVLMHFMSFSQVAKNDLLLNAGYYNDNNHLQYLKATAKTKIDGKFTLVPDIQVSFFIIADTPAGLLGKAVTNEKGEAVLFIPGAARETWNKSPKQSFIVTSEATRLYDPVKANLDITKARIRIDTGTDRKVVAVVTELKDSIWTPVKGVDVKVAVKRMDGDLNVGEVPLYTTDSLGGISADFKRDGLPGDKKGFLTLIAKIEDNDAYGNLTIEKAVPWGIAHSFISQYDRRTLFARRGRSPLWLEWMAYGIIAAVWGVLLYLAGQIRKLKKMGMET